MAIRYLSGVNIDTNTFFVDSTNNKVGIGTGTPSAKLDIDGAHVASIGLLRLNSSAANMSAMTYYIDGVYKAATYAGTDDNFYVWGRDADIVFNTTTSGTTRMVITNGGNVGIGTTGPTQKLMVGGSIRVTGGYYDSSNSIGSNGQVLASTGTGTAWINVGGGTVNGSGTVNYLSKWTGTTLLGDSQLFDNGTNVGVGTATPAAKLDVSGNVRAAAALISQGGNNSWTGAAIFMDWQSTYGRIGAYNYATSAWMPISLNDNSIYITGANGNVGLGTTAPGVKLEVAGGIRATTSSGQIDVDPTSGAFRFYDGTTFRGGLGTGGWASVGATADIVQYLNGVNYYISNGSTALVKVEPTGKVGIGTTSPSTKLSVSGSDDVASTGVIEIITSGGTNLKIGGNTTYSWIQSHNSSPLYINQLGNNLILNLGGGSVGIGTASPGYKLDVSAAARVYGVRIGRDFSIANRATVRLDSNGDAPADILFGQTAAANQADWTGVYWSISSRNSGAGAAEGNKFTIWRGDAHSAPNNSESQFITITPGLNLGIGETSPTQKLHVSGNVRVTGAYYDSSNAAGTSGQILSSTGTGTAWISPGGGGGIITGSGTTNYVTKWTGTSAVGDSSIYDNGNVGIGTSTPSYKLQVNGNAAFATNSGGLRIDSYDANTAVIRPTVSNGSILISDDSGTVGRGVEFLNGGGIVIQSLNTYDPLSVQSNGSTILLAKSSGNVGIGTADPIASLDNQGSAGTYRQRGLTTMVTNNLGAAGTQAKRFEIARASIDYNDWNTVGPIEVELYERYYSRGLKKKYVIYYGYVSSSGCNLVEMTGSGDNQFMVSIGPEVVISGDNRYIPIYVDVRYYSQVTAVVKTNRELTLTNPPGNGSIWMNNMPTGVDISDFTPDNSVYVGNLIGGNSLFTTGNVGIGTTNPIYALDINNTGASTARVRVLATTNYSLLQAQNSSGVLYLGIDDSSGGGFTSGAYSRLIWSSGAYPLIFATNDVERVRITSAGNVGIGTTAPESLLHLSQASTGGDGAFLFIDNPASSTLGNTAGIRFATNAGASFSGYGSFIQAVNTNAGNGAESLTFGTWNGAARGERMRIDSSGSVGINTTNPAYKLDVIGSIRSYGGLISNGYHADTYIENLLPAANNGAGQGDVQLRMWCSEPGISWSWAGFGYNVKNDGASPYGFGRVNTSFGQAYMRFSTDGNLYFYNANTSGTRVETMTLTNGGSVGIGTTAPSQLLHVSGNIRVTGAYYDSANSAGTSGQILSSTGTGTAWIAAPSGGGVSGSGTTNYVTKWTSGSAVGNSVMYDNGTNVGIGTTAPTAKLHIDSADDNAYALRVQGNTNNSVGVWTGIGIAGEGSNTKTAILFEDIGVSYSRGKMHFALNNATDQTSATPANAVMTLIPAGNVGIGTTSPTARLTIGANTSVQSTNGIALGVGETSLEFVHATFQNGFGSKLYSVDSGGGITSLRIATRPNSTSWSDAVTIIAGTSGNGNVGIGTTAPDAKLHVFGNVGGGVGYNGGFYADTGSGSGIDTNWGFDFSKGGGDDYSTRVKFYPGAGSSRKLGFYDSRNNAWLGYFDGNANSNPNFVFSSSGNVGIGTTAPNAKLDVAGGINTRNTRVNSAEKYPLGHYSFGETVFEIDPTWTEAQLQDYFNSSGVTWVADSTAPGGYAIQIDGSVNVGAGEYDSGFPYIPVDNSQDDWYYMECYIKNDAGSSIQHYMGGIDFNQNFASLGGNPGSYTYNVMFNYNPGTSWTKVYGYWNGFGSSYGSAGTGNTNNWVSGTKYFTPQALFNYGLNSGIRRCYISGWKCVRVRATGNRYYSNNVLVSGNVGIGTTAPLHNLSVAGKIGGATFSDSYVEFPSSGHTILKANNDVIVGYSQSFCVKQGGNVGIGTTAPSQKLHVVGNSSDVGIRIDNDAVSGRDWFLYSRAASGIKFSIYDFTGTADRFGIDENGNVGIGVISPAYKLDVSGTIRATGDVIAYSDARVKENVETIDGALDKVMKMRGVSYNKIGEQEKKVGVIAQEILEVLPEVVSQDESGTYSVAYGNIVSVLIEAIKEQQKQIDELKAKLK